MFTHHVRVRTPQSGEKMMFRVMSLAVGTSALLASAAVAQVTPGRTPIAQPAEAVAQAAPAAPKVGGVEMLPTRSIVENAALAPNLSTLVTAVKAAGLDTTLAGPGPFTVFAPTNDAFTRLAPGTVDTLLKPANKATLTRVLSYHVVAGAITAEALLAQINAGGGTATLTTVEGTPLTATLTTGAVTLTDANGNKSFVEQADVKQANGIVHVVNGVVIPKL